MLQKVAALLIASLGDIIASSLIRVVLVRSNQPLNHLVYRAKELFVVNKSTKSALSNILVNDFGIFCALIEFTILKRLLLRRKKFLHLSEAWKSSEGTYALHLLPVDTVWRIMMMGQRDPLFVIKFFGSFWSDFRS